jgi:hypothetical protein
MKKRHGLVALLVGALLLAVLVPLSTAFFFSLGILLVPAVPILAVVAVAALLHPASRVQRPAAPRRQPMSPGRAIFAS